MKEDKRVPFCAEKSATSGRTVGLAGDQAFNIGSSGVDACVEVDSQGDHCPSYMYRARTYHFGGRLY
jgi:hypothetical protein